MGVRRYGISLRVFNSIAHAWAQQTGEVSSWTREEKFHFCKQPCIFFVYYINAITLYWQEESTLSANENKGSTIPEKKSWTPLALKLKMKKCVETPQKQTMSVIFNTRNSQLSTFTYRQKKSFGYMAKIGLWQNYQSSIFVFSREKCHY